MPQAPSQFLRLKATSLEELKKLASNRYLFAVLDACNLPLAPKKVAELGETRGVSLYRGSAEEEFWEIAPYLVRVEPSLLDWILLNAKSDAWGIFIATKSDLDVVRRHLRHFLKVQSSKGEIWHFRFYDPRVLEFFLPTCSAAELRSFFGPIQAYATVEIGSDSVKLWQETTKWNSVLADQNSKSGVGTYFRLRAEQEKAFEKYAEQVFVRDTVLYVKEQHADKVEGLSDKAVEQRVKLGMARARSYGLKREGSILFFLALMFDIAPNFDEQPGIHKALLSGDDSPDVRMDELLDKTSDDDWDQAEESYDERTWNPAA